MKRRVLIDLETTALTPELGEILRLYARDLNDPSSTFDQLVNGWVMDGKHRADVQQIDSAKEKINATFYSSKKGIARMLIA